LHAAGTAFQQRVWQAMREIPLGETISYGALAKQLNSSARAVGNACRTNPIPIIIPCHRIVAKHGIGGFSGMIQGTRITMKEWLLRHEGIFNDFL
jgi:methylated-DNA-[protein]-cysteine S-methyltransferase